MPTIIEAARAMLGVCDGAVTRDQVGFNGADSPFVASLFQRRWLSEKQLAALHRLLGKYRGQLSSYGFDYTALEIPPAGPQTSATEGDGIHETKETAPVEADVLPVVRVEASARAVPTAAATVVQPWPVTDPLASFPPQFTPRPQQREAIAKIQEAFVAGKRVVVLEMPTGGGKSLICQAFARAIREAGKKTHFLTIQKSLQGQYSRDFPAPEIEVLKGRANYPCSLNPTRNCGAAKCTDMKKGILSECIVGGADPETRRKAVTLQLRPEDHLCPYWKQLQTCSDSSITLFNFSSFLFQQRIGRFGKRDLMIIDEGHQIETQLMGYVSLELTEWTLGIIGLRIDRDITSKVTLIEWLREKEVFEKITKLLDKAGKSEDDDMGDATEIALDRAETEALRDLQGKLENFLRYLDMTEWIIETVEYKNRRNETQRKISARPLFAKDFANDLLFCKADRVLVMSATILDIDVWARNLGLKREEIAHVQTPCDFPVENRPVFLTYAGNCSRKEIDQTRPKLVRAVQSILKQHEGQRGLIHTHSFDLSNLMRDQVRSPRFLFQENFDGNKEVMLAEHARRPDSVIVAPAMAEGLDLHDDLGRFQIILKMPWPSLGDKVIKERAARDERFYGWLCALKFTQSLGRTTRSKTDWSYTYVLDSGLEGFLSRNRSLIPQWAVDAFQRYGPKEIRRA
jgi:Rad3-related DNA helicase